MNLGGPVWHASAAAHRPYIPQARLEVAVYALLEGYGAPEAGEWLERTAKAVHLRRRLSAAEEARVGPVVDVRGTPEARRRVAAVWDRLQLAGPQALEVGKAEMYEIPPMT
jgi:hypothetical protein